MQRSCDTMEKPRKAVVAGMPEIKGKCGKKVRRGSNMQTLGVYFKTVYFLLRAMEGFKLGSDLIQCTF